MNVLVGCEESQRVCIEFRKLGHRAFSCDILDCSGGHPEWHIKGDVREIIDGSCIFETMDGTVHGVNGRWDLIVSHPPCTYLTVSGNRWFNVDRYGDKALQREREREKAADFFMLFANAECDHIAIENPIGWMNTHYRKADQIINPYQFGHPVRKATCLWLKGLPKLEYTDVVEYESIHSKGKAGGFSGNLWHVKDENGKIIPWNDPRTAKERSKTYQGIAKAIAEQWSKYIESMEENNA